MGVWTYHGAPVRAGEAFPFETSRYRRERLTLDVEIEKVVAVEFISESRVPSLGEREADAGSPGESSRAGSRRDPRWPRSRPSLAPTFGAPARVRRVERDDRAAPGAAGGWVCDRVTRSSPSAIPFIATANAIRYCGATPVFVDIDRATFNMNPTQVGGTPSVRARARCSSSTNYGMPCDLRALTTLAARHSLPSRRGTRRARDRQRDSSSTPAGSASVRPHGAVACFLAASPKTALRQGDGGVITTADPARSIVRSVCCASTR